jgi:hypothetical protein
VAVTAGQVFLAVVYGLFGVVFLLLALLGALLPPDVEVRRRRLMAACFAVTFVCWGGSLLDRPGAVPTGVLTASLVGLAGGLAGALVLLRGRRA